MRPLLLLGVAAAVLGGCDLITDCSFDSSTRDQGVEATAVAALPDSVVVAVVETPLLRFYGGEPPVVHDPRRTAGADSVRVYGTVTTRRATPGLTARLDIRGDTVFVSLDEPLVHLACSPSPTPGEGGFQIELPPGVVVRRIVAVPQGPARVSADPFPVSRPLLRA